MNAKVFQSIAWKIHVSPALEQMKQQMKQLAKGPNVAQKCLKLRPGPAACALNFNQALSIE